MTIETSRMLDNIRKFFTPHGSEDGDPTRFAITATGDEWRRKLTSDQYHILREHGTERPGSSALLDEHRAGTYRCAGCGEAVYASDAKFDSGTGWPSFTAPVGDGVETATDRTMLMTRTEVHCARCGGHLGHRFADGPRPTGMRHCINGAALAFDPDDAECS